jgi:uncharacterized protein
MANEACNLNGGEGVNEQTILDILRMKTIAVVGCSPKPERASHYVAEYMMQQGYKVIPVNPGFQEILGEKCYPNLLAIPEKVDLVNIFRRPEEVFPIIQDAIKIKAKAIWMQDGIEHPLGAQKAIEAGLKVVQNDCLMREHRRRGGFNKTVTTC